MLLKWEPEPKGEVIKPDETGMVRWLVIEKYASFSLLFSRLRVFV